jgi:hypothetical protein
VGNRFEVSLADGQLQLRRGGSGYDGGSKTSTLSLQVENVNPVPVDIVGPLPSSGYKYGCLAPQMGESQICNSKM